MTLHRNYTIAAFVVGLGSLLSWSIQPLAARALLPIFGGSNAVWTSSLIFFQLALLIGYLLSHWVASRSKSAFICYLVLMATATVQLPVDFFDVSVGNHPVGDVWLSLCVCIGLPSLILYACSPLVQWVLGDSKGQTTFTLFAWSNGGSLLGLLSYPFLIEPNLTVSTQFVLWSVLFGIFCLALATIVISHRLSGNESKTERHQLKIRWLWFCPSALGVALLVSISEAISVDLTVTPILWILPLAVYLVTFIVTFGFPRLWMGQRVWFLGVLVLTLFIYLRLESWSVHWSMQLAGWCTILGVGCLCLHAELVKRQPATQQLTNYYVSIAAGGVIGGLIVGSILPAFINLRLEVDFTIMATVGYLWHASRKRSEGQMSFASLYPSTVIGLTSLVCLGSVLTYRVLKELSGETHVYRNAYGTLKIKRYPVPRKKGGLIHLLDGRISHGFQYLGDTHRREPTAYFTEESGIGRILNQRTKARKVGVLGLGVGTLSAYSRPGDSYTFFELNPLVVDIAKTHFSYLKEARGIVKIVVGDGRKSLERMSKGAFDLLIIDAFTGDAIPAHLLTEEAFSIYAHRLRSDGLLAINVSNRHANLRRVVESHCHKHNLPFSWIRHRARSPLGVYVSEWAFVAKDLNGLQQHKLPALETTESNVTWRDDFAPVLPILK
ncbi:MAG: fused MFS/spermidine synthase [Myxococcota bacterium]|nr:fused MFS/spermidine synthase [Myxococcota bacterium]